VGVNLCGIANGADATPSRYYRPGHHLHWTRFIKQVAKKPVLGVAATTDSQQDARSRDKGMPTSLVRRGRPSRILPSEENRGSRYDDIRVCIGCNVCISRWRSADRP